MITAWMVLVALVGVLLAAGALSADRALRALAGPARWAWGLSLAGCVALAAAAPLRMSSVAATPGAAPLVARTVSGPVAPASSRVHPLDALSASIAHGVALAARAVPPGVARTVALGWLALSLATLLAFVLAYVHVRGLRRGWAVAELAGASVRVAPDAGPAVIGLRHAAIVVPRWLLGRDTREQQLVVRHEREHMVARDNWLLAAGCAAAAMVPWHPAVWWMLARLRLAIELDCDRRVLARDADVRSYGSLLIALAGRRPGFLAGGLALADTPSHLERRLLAMTSRRPHALRASIYASLIGAFGLVAIVAACEARLPTSSEIQGMDVAGAENAVANAGVSQPGTATEYYLDGRHVPRQQALAVPRDRIASIDVVKRSDPTAPATVAEVHVTTMPEDGAISVSPEMTIRARGLTETPVGFTTRGAAPTIFMKAFNGLLFVDGQPANQDVLHTLDPDHIQKIEVLKGAAARRLYSDPAAANGVIRITTKPAGAGR
jgi:bla regulator protein blaR1